MKDKNGAEIREGDKVRPTQTHGDYVWPRKFTIKKIDNIEYLTIPLSKFHTANDFHSVEVAGSKNYDDDK
ncbi:MAG: hypothetical protein CMB80_34785 [Flammeovirgaceae bacterium]|nr:hypothetical protein [Flammeovirgaceae bacterium]|tara:strand:- start:642 stop:851 length:210 start_codon:yes stop_codon:yes gene_type:complete